MKPEAISFFIFRTVEIDINFQYCFCSRFMKWIIHLLKIQTKSHYFPHFWRHSFQWDDISWMHWWRESSWPKLWQWIHSDIPSISTTLQQWGNVCIFLIMNMLCAYQYTLDDFYGGKIFFSLYRMCSWRFKIPSAADTVTPRGIPIGAQYKSISSTINLHCDAFSVGIAQV